MIEYLKSKGIPSVRQTVYTDLEALDTAGIDIVQIKSTQNRYFIGSRIFEYPELKMLVDAVASSKVISAKKSQALIQKLGQLTSIQQAEQLQRLASLSSRVKPHNEKVYYIIDSIQTAILDQHQISFQYYEYTPEKKKILKHDGYRYILDPYALEWKNDHYYLIGYSHKHKGIAHFRVDRLTSVEPLDSKFQPMPDFDVAAYTNKMVDMFAAEHTEQVKLLCSNELMRVIIDHYGEDIEISPYLREEAGIPAGAKLCVYVDDEEKTVTIAEAGYDHDLRDVPPYLLEMLGEAGICLGELEEQLMVGNLIYGERTACNGQEEHGDE